MHCIKQLLELSLCVRVVYLYIIHVSLPSVLSQFKWENGGCFIQVSANHKLLSYLYCDVCIKVTSCFGIGMYVASIFSTNGSHNPELVIRGLLLFSWFCIHTPVSLATLPSLSLVLEICQHPSTPTRVSFLRSRFYLECFGHEPGQVNGDYLKV